MKTSVPQLYAECSVKVEEQLRDDMWSGHTSEPHQVLQEADEAELNNYLQAQECAVFTEYSSIIILNNYFFKFSLINVWFSEQPLKCLRHFIVHIHHFIYSVFNIKPFGWLVLLAVCHLVSDNK